MQWLKAAMQNWFGKQRLERELDAELAAYVEMKTEEYMAAGLPPEAARRKALVEVGSVESVKQQVREVRSGRFAENLLQDLRFGMRMVRKSPGFTIVAVLTLALGIGANSAMFSAVNAVLLRPLPFHQPEQLVKVWTKFDQHGIPRNWVSEPEWWELNERTQIFSDLAVFRSGIGVNLGLEGGNPVRLPAGVASAGLFRLLGVKAALGRTYSPEDDAPGATPVVVIADGLWRRQFGADPNIIGRPVLLDGVSTTVIGVLPAGFRFAGENDIWLPIALNRAQPQNRGSHYLEVVGRLKPGVSLENASAQLHSLAMQLQDEGNYPPDSGWGIYPVPLHEELVGGLRPALLVLLGAVGFVLLIACVNLANLLLARASVREKEVAIRVALGASRTRIVRQLLTENMLIAILGGAAALIVAHWGVQLLRAVAPADLAQVQMATLDPNVLLFTLALTLATGLIFGVVPAAHAVGKHFHQSAQHGGRATADGSRQRLGQALVVGEVALALLLLTGAGLMLKSLQNIANVEPGYDPDHLLTWRLALPPTQYDTPEKRVAFHQNLLQRLGALPGVRAAGAISNLPLSSTDSSGSTYLEDTSITGTPRSQQTNLPYIEADWRSASPGYFEAMHIQLLEGRVFNESDTATSPLVMMVDESFARRMWGDRSAIGRRISTSIIPGSDPPQRQWREIVGVVRHVKHLGLNVEGREQIYFPMAQRPASQPFFVVRTQVPPQSLVGAVQHEVFALDRGLPIFDVKLMDERVAQSVAQPRFSFYLLALFAGLALVLAALGIYGVISYTVAQRTNEIGIRMALGARPLQVVGLVLGRTLRLAVLGVVLGAIGSLLVLRGLSSLLFQVQPRDPGVLVAVGVLLVCVAAFAGSVPARRAALVDPMVALRHE